MITVFGSINMDLIATTARLPTPGETVSGSSFSTAAGGKGANQALAATRAGASVLMAGAVGRDAFGPEALALLKDAGTALSHVKETDQPTGTATIIVGGDGENVIVVVPGSNGEVTVGDAEAAIEATPHGSYMMLQFEVPPAAVEAALKAAKANGVTTVINTAPLTPEAPALARLADIVIANETEFELFAGKTNLSDDARIDTMRSIHDETGQTLIVTLGSEGVVAIHNGTFYKVPALKITPVDTVGAGDTFCGYLTASLDAGMDFEAALARAVKAGSLACLKPGAQPAIPLASDVDAVA